MEESLTALAGMLLRSQDPAGRDTSLPVAAAERVNALTVGSDADVVRLLGVAKATEVQRSDPRAELYRIITIR